MSIPAGRRAPSSEAFVLEAETLRALAHPTRLRILSLLHPEGDTVTDIAEALDLSLPNVSQHLRVLRDRGIVRAERAGQAMRYRLTNPAFQSCCSLVRQVIVDEARRRGAVLESVPVTRGPPQPIPA